jgi:hypothetical protein
MNLGPKSSEAGALLLEVTKSSEAGALLLEVTTSKSHLGAKVPSYYFHYQFLYLQITTGHVFKTDCGVCVSAAGNTCCDMLVVVGDRACKNGKNVS